MRKISKIFVVVLLLVLLSSAVLAEATEQTEALRSGDYTYILREDAAVITGYTGKSGIISIPDTLDGHPVTGIADLAFAGNETLFRVNIPLSVTEIGVNPFAGCPNLRRIYVSPHHEVFSTKEGVLFRKDTKTLISCSPQMWARYSVPEEIREIGEMAFYASPDIKEIYLPDSVVTIGDGAFAECGKLSKVILGKKLTALGEGAFQSCEKLGSITIPNGVKEIRCSTFRGCRSLTKVELPNALEQIESSAFENCDALSYVDIPDTVTSIAEKAFYSCDKLTGVQLSKALEELGNSVFEDCINLSDITIPASLHTIPLGTFRNCRSLQSAVFKGTVKNIEEQSFTDCRELQTLSFQTTVESIGEEVFAGCEKLTEVQFGGELHSLGKGAFRGCTALVRVNLPKGLKAVSEACFADCTALNTVLLSAGAATVEANAFRACSELRYIYIPDGMESIGAAAFAGCEWLFDLELPDSVSAISSDAFAGCDDLCLTVNRDSYGEQYALENGRYYRFYDSYDWLLPVKVGDYVIFGTYEQDNDLSNGAEKIEWLVLDVQEEKALVISRYALDCQLYNSSYTEVTWETCGLRTWLNGTFLNNAFSAAEQKQIQKTTVSADKNPKYSTDPGKATTDKVFLLSVTEAEKYFSSDNERQCKPTNYVVANKTFVNSDSGNCFWCLRTPGDCQTYVVRVDRDGSVHRRGLGVNNYGNTVRPAMWVDVDALEAADTYEVPKTERGNGTTYTASAKGISSDVKVTITFVDGKVSDVKIDASGETELIGGKAAPVLETAIKQQNRPDVDAVSGASLTSAAVIEAAKSCFDQAGVTY